MAVNTSTITGINPQPRTKGEELRNWQRLSSLFLAGGDFNLNPNGNIALAMSLHIVTPAYLIATGSPGGAGTLTSINGTLTLSSATESAHTFLAGGATASGLTPTFRVIIPTDLATGPTDTYVLTINSGGNQIWAPGGSGTGQWTPTPPTSSGDTGTAGDYSGDTSWFYICVAANTWRRVAVTTFGGGGSSFTDLFTRADGPVGNSWVDNTATGSIYSIASNLLTATTNDFVHNWLYRPPAEDEQDMTVSSWVTAGIALVLARIQAPDKCYAAYFDGSNLKIDYLNAGSQTNLASVICATPGGVEYILKLVALSTSPTTTDLTATVAASATPLTIIATASVTGDTTAALQNVAGAAGIATYNSTSWSKFTWTSP